MVKSLISRANDKWFETTVGRGVGVGEGREPEEESESRKNGSRKKSRKNGSWKKIRGREKSEKRGTYIWMYLDIYKK